MMRKKMILLCCMVMVIAAQAQDRKAIWTFSAKKIKTSYYELHFTAKVEQGWNIYSQFTPKGGPMPTSINFSPNSNVLLGGNAKELGIKRVKHEDVFGVDVHYFTDKVEFVQVIKLKELKPDMVKGTINFMTCDKEQCINDVATFSIALK